MAWDIDHEEARIYAQRQNSTPSFNYLVNLARAYLDLRAQLQRVKAERAISRAAGRRLAAYWRTQCDGAEGLHEMMVQKWRADLGRALGLDEPPLFPEACAAVEQLRARAEAAEAREAGLRNRLTNLSDPAAIKSKLDYFDPGEEWAAGYAEAMSRVRRAIAGEKGGASDAG